MAAHFLYQVGDIVELISDVWKGTHANADRNRWHNIGDLATIMFCTSGMSGEGQELALVFHNCTCPRFALVTNCIQLHASYVKIHLTSPRFLIGNRWEKLVKEE